MDILVAAGILLASYLIGSIPFGYLIVCLTTGIDVRKVESGRTGGTNAMRAAGFWAGFATAILDTLKGAGVTWLARWLLPGFPWMHILAPILAVLGHNHSIFLLERHPTGKLRFRGGAGGAPALGGAVGLWAPSLLIILPLGALILFGIGYASVTTMSVPIMAIAIFAVRAAQGLSPREYVWYGVLAEVLLVLALLPNLKRLVNGTERLVGWRARHKREKPS